MDGFIEKQGTLLVIEAEIGFFAPISASSPFSSRESLSSHAGLSKSKVGLGHVSLEKERDPLKIPSNWFRNIFN